MSLRRLVTKREESLAVQSILLTSARAAGFVVTFFIPVILVRVFDQGQFGTYKQLFLVAGSAVPLLNLGMYASLFYFIPRDEGEGHRYLVQALALLGVTGALAGLGLLAGGDAISRVLNLPSLREFLPLVALYIVIATPADMVVAVPTVDRRPALAAYTMAASDVLRAVAIVGAAVITNSVRGVLWAAISVSCLRGLWLLLYVRVRRAPGARRPCLADLTAQLRYALPFAVGGLFLLALERFHQYYVAANVSAAAFAIYAVGILQLPVVGMLEQSVVEVMLIRGSQAYEAGDLGEVKRVWTIVLERLAVVLVPCWALAELLAPDLIGLLFGPAYLPALPVFRVFLVTVLALIIVDHGVLRATGDTPFVFVANATGLVISVAAILVLTRYSLLLGGVAGYVIGLLATRALGLVKVRQRLDVRWGDLLPWRVFGQIALVVSVSAAVAGTGLFLPGRLVRLAIVGAIFTFVYGWLVIRLELIPSIELRRIVRRLLAAYLSNA